MFGSYDEIFSILALKAKWSSHSAFNRVISGFKSRRRYQFQTQT